MTNHLFTSHHSLILFRKNSCDKTNASVLRSEDDTIKVNLIMRNNF